MHQVAPVAFKMSFIHIDKRDVIHVCFVCMPARQNKVSCRRVPAMHRVIEYFGIGHSRSFEMNACISPY